MIKEIPLTNVCNPRRAILLEGEKYLVAGDLMTTTTMCGTSVANTPCKVFIFLVTSTGIGNLLGSFYTAQVFDVTLDKHGCILILMTNYTVSITNVTKSQYSGSKEIISLAAHSLTVLDQMHFDMVHERLYLGRSAAPELVVFKMD